MRICSRADASSCTAASARRCATMSPPLLRPNRSCWRITSPRRALPKRQSNGGAKRDSGRWSTRRWLKRQSSLGSRLDQISALPATPALRREEIKLQVALITPLLHVKGYAAPETKAAAERARVLIEQAEALGEPPEDPLLLFSVLYGFWVANFIAFNGDVVRDLAAQFLALAETQGTTVPLMIGHRIMGNYLVACR